MLRMMPLLTDQGQLDKIGRVLARWSEARVVNWLQHPRDEALRACPGRTLDEINEALYQHHSNNGVINRVDETTPTLQEMGKDCFYEFRIMIGDKKLYVKARFVEKAFYVVSAHEGHQKP